MTFSPTNIIAVASGGAVGAVLRFYTSITIVKHFPHDIPFATLTVNIIGSFIIGILVALFLHFTPSPIVKGFLITGFLGALTTYSTFAIESYMLLNNHFWYGVLNVILNVAGTIVAAGAGYKLLINFISK